MSFYLFSTPQQQQPQQQSLLGTQSRPFQFTTPLWSQQRQQQQYLFTNDKAPASYGTKWTDLHPDSQKVLLQIEERILESRAENQSLDQCSRLSDSSVSGGGFEHDASHILQELEGIYTGMERQKTLLQELMSSVKYMLRNTEVALQSFVRLRPRFIHQSGSGTSIATAPSQAPGATTTPGSISQPLSAIVPIFDIYSGLPKKPSPYLQQTVARFEKYIGECCQWIEELEQLIRLDLNVSTFSSSPVDSLPKVMMNAHDFFIHVAAKVERIHQYLESMKTAYLVDQRRRGEVNDPFLEADRRETARQEAAAKRVHPTLHLPPNSQPSTQVAGLFASSSTPGPQTSGVVTSAASGSSFSLLGTPSSAPSMPSTSLFSTPSTSAPNSSLFGPSSSASPQTPLLGSTSTPSLLSSTPAFGSTPAAGGSLFSTPVTSGATEVGSGASLGPIRNKSRPKPRAVVRH